MRGFPIFLGVRELTYQIGEAQKPPNPLRTAVISSLPYVSVPLLLTVQLGLTNVVSGRDAQALPYPAVTFDAAYLAVVLGEIPDQGAALRELARVLKPGGRLVVGEVLPDFHMVPFGALKARAEEAGLRFERRLGGPLGYFASFRAPRDGARTAGENL